MTPLLLAPPAETKETPQPRLSNAQPAAIESEVKVNQEVKEQQKEQGEEEVVDPETRLAYVFEDGGWRQYPRDAVREIVEEKETAP